MRHVLITLAACVIPNIWARASSAQSSSESSTRREPTYWKLYENDPPPSSDAGDDFGTPEWEDGPPEKQWYGYQLLPICVRMTSSPARLAQARRRR